jgi:hypothetical protein
MRADAANSFNEYRANPKIAISASTVMSRIRLGREKAEKSSRK